MSNRRKKQFVESAVQGALLRRIVLHWLLFFTIAFFALPLWSMIQTADFSRPFASLMWQSWFETAPVFLLLIALLPLFAWDTITLSNRFAGPIYRLHKTIRSLGAGEGFRPIKLRKGDFWTDLADDFNDMVERWNAENETDESDAETDAESDAVSVA